MTLGVAPFLHLGSRSHIYTLKYHAPGFVRAMLLLIHHFESFHASLGFIGGEEEGSMGDEQDGFYFPTRILAEVKEFREMKFLVECEDCIPPTHS